MTTKNTKINAGEERIGGSVLSEQITALCKGLVYVSEIDSQVKSIFAETEKNNQKLKKLHNELKRLLSDNDRKLEIFREKLTRSREWHSSRHTKNAEGFGKLFSLLSEELTGLSLVRFGKIEIEIYVVGFDIDGNLQGFVTRAFET
jgi:hypothetical protein